MQLLTDAEKDHDLYMAAKAGIVDAARYVAYFTDKAITSTDEASRQQYMEYAQKIGTIPSVSVDDYIEHTLKPILCDDAKQVFWVLAYLPFFKLYLMRLCIKGYVIPADGYLHLKKLSVRRFITLIRYLYDKYYIRRWQYFETLFNLPAYTMSKSNTHINPDTKSFQRFLRSLFD